VYVVDEPEKITAENFYKKTQAAVETGFFPGSVQKQAFMSKLGKAVFADVQQLPLYKKIRLPFMLLALLREKQVFVYLPEDKMEAYVHLLGFDGSMTDIRGKNTDYLAFFESNLGANKANCCIKRNVSMRISSSNGAVGHELLIQYANTNPTTLKQPPQYWGGAYVNFLRIAVPIGAHIMSLKVGNVAYPVPEDSAETHSDTIVNLMGVQTDEQLRSLVTNDDPTHIRVDVDRLENKGIKMLGFFVIVDALGENTVDLKYETRGLGKNLILQKQSGVDSYPLTYTINSIDKKIDIKGDILLPE
jgi:hypothetical protein